MQFPTLQGGMYSFVGGRFAILLSRCLQFPVGLHSLALDGLHQQIEEGIHHAGKVAVVEFQGKDMEDTLQQYQIYQT